METKVSDRIQELEAKMKFVKKPTETTVVWKCHLKQVI